MNRVGLPCPNSEITTDSLVCSLAQGKPSGTKEKFGSLHGLPKGDKLEFVVQKCCELGAVKLVPFVSASAWHKSKKDDQKRGRLQKSPKAW